MNVWSSVAHAIHDNKVSKKIRQTISMLSPGRQLLQLTCINDFPEITLFHAVQP